MKSLALLVLLLGLALAYRKSHSHSHSRHRKVSHRSRHRKCPDPFEKKVIPVSTDINQHHFNKTAEAWAKLGMGAYSEKQLKHIKMREPIKVNSLYYDNLDRTEHETESKNYMGDTYYDPSQDIYGDQVICNRIQNPHICVA